MKLLITILCSLAVARTLLEEVKDVFDNDEDKDIAYSNGKLADTHLPRLFKCKLFIRFMK